MERALGILFNVANFAQASKNMYIDFAEDTVRACCVLHNFVREKDDCNFDHTLYAEGQVDIPNSVLQQASTSRPKYKLYSRSLRELFCEQ
jgi:hypothetical protein